MMVTFILILLFRLLLRSKHHSPKSKTVGVIFRASISTKKPTRDVSSRNLPYRDFKRALLSVTQGELQSTHSAKCFQKVSKKVPKHTFSIPRLQISPSFKNVMYNTREPGILPEYAEHDIGERLGW